MTETQCEALERFSIQTVDGNLDDVTAIKWIEKKYGRVVAVWVWDRTHKKDISQN